MLNKQNFLCERGDKVIVRIEGAAFHWSSKKLLWNVLADLLKHDLLLFVCQEKRLWMNLPRYLNLITEAENQYSDTLVPSSFERHLFSLWKTSLKSSSFQSLYLFLTLSAPHNAYTPP